MKWSFVAYPQESRQVGTEFDKLVLMPGAQRYVRCRIVSIEPMHRSDGTVRVGECRYTVEDVQEAANA